MLRILNWLVVLALTVAVSIGAVVVLATYEELTAKLPPIDRLLEYDPPVATRVYADDGSLIEEFFRERRYRVPIADIPPLVRNAFLAAEDAKFFSHRGVDFQSIARAALANLRAGDVVQGASTITQQVVKALLLSPERSYERKLKEILLALRLEQQVGKQQILELYLNQIYLGDGNHGVGAAALNYFGKDVRDLSPAEAAMLAGLPAAPSRYSPNRSPEAARSRQLYVLRRMHEEHFLTTAEYQAAVDEKLRLVAPRRKQSAVVRNYYTEAVRLQLEDMFGAEAPYNQGYSVYTAMQPRLQNLAEVAVRNGIERIDKALGYRGPVAHFSAPEEQRQHIENAKDELSGQPLDPERIYQAVVTGVSSGRIEVALGGIERDVSTSGVRWNWQVKSRTFRVGDVVEVRTREPGTSGGREALPGPEAAEDLPEGSDQEPAAPKRASGETGARKDDDDSVVKLHLAQTPQIEAALVAIDTDSGGIAAMVGGYDFMGSQFNRALQAMRQPGSAFKPFVYAAALDNGYTAASILQDSPVEYQDNDKVWTPRNYTRDYKGPIRLRIALEQSRNVVSVKLVDAVGIKTVVDYLDRFRLGTKLGENLSIALGTSELTLRQLTEGYTVFANGGVKVEPVVIRRIEDKDGIAFFADEPKRREVLSPDSAAVMTYILEGVVERGTATSVKALDRPVAGKTGTTNEQRDAWFVGYTPNLTVGVWVGFDDPTQTMGKMGTGGRVAAPIWLDFMKPALTGTPVRDFEIPDDISCVNIDPYTGRRASEWTAKPFLECFKSGTEPGVYVASAPEAPDDGSTVYSDAGAAAPPATTFTAPADPWASPQDAARAELLEDVGRQLGDPRWPSQRNPDSRIGDPWPDPGQPVPEGHDPAREREKLRAETVETERGTEVRLFRDSDRRGDTPVPVIQPPPPLPPGIATEPRDSPRYWPPEVEARPAPRPPMPLGPGPRVMAPPPPPPATAPAPRVDDPSARSRTDGRFRSPPSTAPEPHD